MADGLTAAMRKVRRGGCAFSGLVSEDQVDQACRQADYRSQASLYTPITTVLAFLAQLIGADGSCQQAVNGLIAQRTAAGDSKCSADTGGYCKARSRLPEEVFWQLARESGHTLEEQAEESWRWKGHRVRVVDGSTLQIADTAKNREQYPLQKQLRPGLHYPVVRILVVFSLAVGSVLEAALSPYQGKGTGETAMLRGLADSFGPGDILLGDRYYSGYWDVAFWLARGVHLVSILSASRKADFRKGKRLGPCDHVVHWKKTPRPDWIDPEAARRTPRTLAMRELRVTVAVPGFRVKHLLVVTTLTDVQAYDGQSLGDLYRLRWQAELNLRSLKTHLGMEHLRCKTPAMMRKEFATYLLTYNCVRRVACEAATEHGINPRQVSFKHTMQTINEFFRRFHQSDLVAWVTALLSTVAEILVGNRPNRIEPYTCKRRPKEFPTPKVPRQTYKRRKTRTK